jgi:hypothetical protein
LNGSTAAALSRRDCDRHRLIHYLDRLEGLVGRRPDRRHRPVVRVGDIDGLPIRRDRDRKISVGYLIGLSAVLVAVPIAGSARYRSPWRKLAAMSEPARELPADSPAVAAAVENARRGVITHLTVGGKRVAAIVPESVIAALRAAEDAEDAADADAAWDEPGESIPLEELEAEFGE